MGQFQTVVQIDFSGGENTVASPYALLPNQAQQAINLVLDEHASARVRDGTLIQGVKSPDPTRPIVKLFDLVQVNGVTTSLAIINGSTFNQLYDRSKNPWTVLGTFSTSYTTPDIIQFLNEAIIAPGNTEQLRVYSPSNFAVGATNAPSASHVATHLSYVWAWNTNNTTTATAGPSSLQASDINAMSFNIANQTFIAKDDGQSGQGLGVFTIAEAGISPTVTIIAFKDFSAYEVSGTFAANNLSVQKIKSDMGCVAPRSIQFVSGFGIIRLSHRGFALYDGVNDTLISEEERPRIFGKGTYIGLDWANISKSMASQVPNPPMYLCACPVQGLTGTNTRVFVYDLVRKAWTVLTYANDIGTLQLILDPGVLPVLLGGDAVTGNVRRYFAGDADDDGKQISWTLRGRGITSGSPTDRSYFRRMLVEASGVSINTVMTATFYYGHQQKSVTRKVVNAVNQLSTLVGYGVSQYGTGAYGDPTNLTGEYTEVFDILGGLIANNVFADVQGTGPGTIRGITWHVQKKPLTRSVTSVLQ